MGSASRPRIGILVVPECSASVVFGMYDLFRAAGRDWAMIVEGRSAEEALAATLVGRARDTMSLLNGVAVTPHASFADDDTFDVVCVPEIAISPDQPLHRGFSEELTWLRAQRERGAIVAAACSGAMLLAEAGMLDGCEATTHWAFCDALQRRHPTVSVRREQALVVSGEGQRLVMAGGGTSWLDLTLYLVARLTDLETAMQLARINLIDWHAVGQQPFARLAHARQTDDAVIAKCQAWIARQYPVAAPVASMVRLSGLSERTFTRRFRAATGLAPLEYVHALRIEAAKQLLEGNEMPLDDVAAQVGYDDPKFFARVFLRAVRLTPAQYRRRFGALRRALTH